MGFYLGSIPLAWWFLSWHDWSSWSISKIWPDNLIVWEAINTKRTGEMIMEYRPPESRPALLRHSHVLGLYWFIMVPLIWRSPPFDSGDRHLLLYGIYWGHLEIMQLQQLVRMISNEAAIPWEFLPPWRLGCMFCWLSTQVLKWLEKKNILMNKYVLYYMQITNIRFLKRIWLKRENYNLPPPAMCFQAFIEIDAYLFPRLVTQTL